MEWGGTNLTYNVADECSSGPKSIPIPLYIQTADMQKENYTIYDQWARTTRPVLLAFFTNGTIFHGSPFADTRLLCTTPKNIAPASHDLTSAADHLSVMDAESMVTIVLALNALFFFML